MPSNTGPSARLLLSVRRLGLCVAAAAAAAWSPMGAWQAPVRPLASYQNLPLWTPGSVPLSQGNGPLDQPFLTVFLPPEGQANGASVIIAPGGGNIMLMYGTEGFEVGERYNDWGVTAFVLTYRLDPYGNAARIADGERAIRLVRAHARDWSLDPARIGFVGFSAGSSMGRAVVAASDPGDELAADPVERVSSRPDYLVLVYGAGRASTGESLREFPPTFLLSAAADKAPSLGNAQLFMDLIEAGAVAELHVYQQGRHGFGGGFGSREFSGWMPTLRTFLEVGGFLPEGE